MTKKDLMQAIGKKENDLIHTNQGLMDIFRVSDGNVYYGLIASGKQDSISIKHFLVKFISK